jgi:hypothetical protein
VIYTPDEIRALRRAIGTLKRDHDKSLEMVRDAEGNASAWQMAILNARATRTGRELAEARLELWAAEDAASATP